MLKRKKQCISCQLLVLKKPAFLALERGLLKGRRKLHLVPLLYRGFPGEAVPALPKGKAGGGIG